MFLSFVHYNFFHCLLTGSWYRNFNAIHTWVQVLNLDIVISNASVLFNDTATHIQNRYIIALTGGRSDTKRAMELLLIFKRYFR